MIKDQVPGIDHGFALVSHECEIIVTIDAGEPGMEHEEVLAVIVHGHDGHAQQVVFAMTI